MILIDSHCHLDFFEDSEKLTLLEHCKTHQVRGLVTIGTRLSQAQTQLDIAKLSTSALKIWCTIATHPEHATEETLCTLSEIVTLTHHPAVIGIGETGLDYFYGKGDAILCQQDSFRIHIRAAQQTQLPLCIHAREADENIIRIISEEYEKGGPFPFLIHCFTSGQALADFTIQKGGYISISGIATFKNAIDLRNIIKTIPLNRILVETDSPFLAPVPKRGKRNEPAFVSYTAEFLANWLNINTDEFATLTTHNFFTLFPKATL